MSEDQFFKTEAVWGFQTVLQSPCFDVCNNIFMINLLLVIFLHEVLL